MINVIWIVTDSARNFNAGGLDDRDRPVFYESLCQDFVNFKYAVTSAPSSVMSGASMLTGMNSYFIGRNYDDFRYEEGAFPNIAKILQTEGYDTKGIFVAREMREKVAPFIGHVERKFWPKERSHAERMWKNEDANYILDKFLATHPKEKPLFLMLWNNIRHDKNINENLDKLLNTVKKNGFYENSVIIFCADHGYPHPRRGFTPEYLKREGLTHDLMLGDDNILVPLLVKSPGCVPRDIESQVGLIDLFPTVLDYVGIDYSNKNSYFPTSGLSLKPVLSNQASNGQFDDRPIRCDCRFFGQPGRKTAIRKGVHKYVYLHDEDLEEYYNIEIDASEDVSLQPKSQNIIVFNELKNAFNQEEKLANKFQRDYIARKFIKAVLSKYINKDVVVISLQEKQINDSIIAAINSTITQNVKFFVGDTSNAQGYCMTLNSFLEKSYLDQESNPKLYKNQRMNCVLVFNETDPEQLELLKLIENNGCKIIAKFDINFNSSNKKPWSFSRVIKAILSRKGLIKSEPKLLYTYAKEYIVRRIKRNY